ncbi:hypothetical protein [Aureimonas jatrophae]|uniref:hypothetical protein n=1 Tax=Aureimonas jatrophae TaxID=1166073 RepID=UPI001113F209|nr:hypothetical protein [Aureimonas jatrophae]MBB3953042.1 hypothetical protein [Aureimonas jatrophae]
MWVDDPFKIVLDDDRSSAQPRQRMDTGRTIIAIALGGDRLDYLDRRGRAHKTGMSDADPVAVGTEFLTVGRHPRRERTA